MAFLAAFGANATEIDVAAYNINYANYGTPVSVVLDAGTYAITYGYTGATGQYQAWDDSASNFGQPNQAPAVDGCDGSGANCNHGYTDAFGYTIKGAAGAAGSFTYLGISSSNAGGAGQEYATAAEAISAYSAALPYTTLTLSGESTVTLFLPDASDNVDNYGGVTLDIFSIPEPASAALFALACIIVGLCRFTPAKEPHV